MSINRREFVTMGTVGLLSVNQLLGQSVVRVFGTQQGAMPILSVGYWNGLVSGAGDQTPSAHVVNAENAGSSGDFSRAGAMVTTIGFWRAPANRPNPESVSLIAFYPEVDPATGQKIPYIAWNVVVQGSEIDGSLRSRFVVPVDAGNRIQLAIDQHAVAAQPVALGFDQLRALVKDPSTMLDLGATLALRNGFYFVALRTEDIQDLPDWSKITVTPLRSTDRVTPNGDSILLGPDGNPVPFDYIVLRIEPYGISDRPIKSPTDRQN